MFANDLKSTAETLDEEQLALYRRIYRRYLARYPIFRHLKRLALYLARAKLPRFGRHKSRAGFKAALRTRKLKREWLEKCRRTGHRAKLISFSDYFNGVGIPDWKIDCPLFFELSVGQKETITGPKFFPKRPPKVRAEESFVTERPRVLAVEFPDAYVLPATDFVIRNGFAIHPDLYAPDRFVFQSERVGTIDVRHSSGELLAATDPPFRLKVGISLLGGCAGNYAHFLTEVLPKLLLIDTIDFYDDVPIIIDFWVEPNIKNAIRFFNTKNRPIFELNYGQPAFCERLVYVTSPSFAPPEYREYLLKGTIPNIEHYEYCASKDALNMVRDKASSLISPAKWIGKRIFVHRAPSAHGNKRTAVESLNLEEVARRAGFDVIEPGALTISDQISAFRDAEVVVTQIGAAMANLIFTKPGCKVICLSPHFEDAEYYYHTLICETMGHDLTYVTGPQVSTTGGHPLHRDYRIDMEEFLAAIEELAPQH